MRVFYRFHVRGVDRVPATGGALLASNHASYFDPVWVACGVVHRQVSIMSTTVVGGIPLLGSLVRALNGLTILKRTGFNKEAMQEFIRVLREEGRLLVVFPEGTRTPDGTLGPARRGISLIAREAGVPVVPAFITGSREFWPKGRWWPWPWGRITVTFGEPFTFASVVPGPAEDPDDAFGRVLMERIAALKGAPAEPVPFGAGLRAILRLGA